MEEEISSRSPYSAIADFRQAQVEPVREPIHGRMRVPGSKSYTNRALIIAALAQGSSTLKGVLKSDDSYWCMDALHRLGVQLHIDEDIVAMEGTGGLWPEKEGELFIGAAGTIARFLPGALAVAQEGEWRVDGVEQLRKRPLTPLVDRLRQLGGNVGYETEDPGLPLRIKGSGLRGGKVQIPGNVSSQYLSGLLIAAPYAKQEVEIQVTQGLVQPAYIGITVQLMRSFGAMVETDEANERFRIQPTGYDGQHVDLEADASTACYFLSLAALTGGTVRIENVGYNSHQPDARFIDVLEKMGCMCVKDEQFLEVTGPEQLQGGFDVDMKPMSDQALTIGALAPFASAPITVRNVAHIRKHESDRIAVICQSLQQMGIEVEEYEDGFKVYPGQPHGAVLDPHDDHRNAMVFALMSVKVPGVTIVDPGCVSKTCPTFFAELQKLGVRVQLTK